MTRVVGAVRAGMDLTGSAARSGLSKATASGQDHEARVAQFLRGVTIGALVGAAIAGSAIWGRHARRDASHRDERQQEAHPPVEPPG